MYPNGVVHLCVVLIPSRPLLVHHHHHHYHYRRRLLGISLRIWTTWKTRGMGMKRKKGMVMSFESAGKKSEKAGVGGEYRDKEIWLISYNHVSPLSS